MFPHNTIHAAPGAASTLRSATKKGFSYTFGGKERTPEVKYFSTPPHPAGRPPTRVHGPCPLINARTAPV